MDQPSAGPAPEPVEPSDRHEPQPRIYVASLSDYNAGRLHGVWIDAAQETEAIWEQINAMLASSPEDGAEEFAVHDYENFGPIALGEYEPIEMVAKIGRGIAKHGIAYAAWAQQLGSSEWHDLDRFEDTYLGDWDSIIEHAQQLLDDLGIDTEVFGPEWLSSYIYVDVDGFARDLAYDLNVIEFNNRVYVFET